MKRFLISSAIGTAILLLGCGDAAQMQLPPPEIPVYVTKGETIPVTQEFVGQIYGQKDIAIRARVEGFLEGIHFQEGSSVTKGKLLYTLESQPFEADEAAKLGMLAEAKTVLAKTVADLNRMRPLAEQKAVSASDLDASVALHDAAIASVEAAEANLRATRIQLSYTRIFSPISGIIGKTQAKVGDFVGREPNPVILNTVSQVDSILVEFFITEEQYLAFGRHAIAAGGNLGGERRNQEKGRLTLVLADGTTYPERGSINFVDREIDSSTGAMLVQASFPNPTGILRPGQFARVIAKIAEIENGILIPQRSVSELQGRYSVMIVQDDETVERRVVDLGAKLSDFWTVLEGLEPGEKVIYEGLQKVREGMTVKSTVVEVEPKNQKAL